MEHFLINSSVCMFSLWLVYKLLLENTSWHRFKRFYLIGALTVSLIIPFIVVKTVSVPINATPGLLFNSQEMVEATTAATGFEIHWSDIFLIAYLLGVIVMSIRLIRNLYGLRIKSSDELARYKGYVLVLRKLIKVPHSFYNKIYASATKHKKGIIPKVVLDHEKAHLDQKHSWDILSIEIMLVILWFNPLLYLIKYSIKLNHEFLADQAVIAAGVDTKTYQETLLAFTAGSQHRAIANTFNFPLIKKRFTIMKTKTTTASGLLRTLAIIPVLALLIISCGQEETEFIEVEETIIVEDDSNDSNTKLIVVDPSLETATIVLNEGTFYYNIKGDKVEFFDLKGNKKDFESLGYKVIISDQIEEIQENGGINLPPPPPPITTIQYIEENQKDLVYYIDNRKVSKSEAIKNIELFGQPGVEISPDKNGNMAIKIKMSAQRWSKMPPPPPPSSPSAPSQEEQIKNGSLKIFINDKIATTAQLNNLAGLKQSDWKNIAVYPSKKDGVKIFHYYGEGL